MEDDLEDFSSVNSELRYLTLELMKIAVQKGKTFKDIAHEFIDNVNYLSKLIEKSASLPLKRIRKRSDG